MRDHKRAILVLLAYMNHYKTRQCCTIPTHLIQAVRSPSLSHVCASLLSESPGMTTELHIDRCTKASYFIKDLFYKFNMWIPIIKL